MSELEYSTYTNFSKDLSPERSSTVFRTKEEQKKYWFLLILLTIGALLCAYGLLVYNNPIPPSSPSFIPIVRRRMSALVAMLIAAYCQSLSTVSFHSITNNRVITPSLLGFESLYSTINTSIIFFLGTTALINFTTIQSFLLQVGIMVLMCLVLYGWLLSGKYGNLQLMLLIGIIMGSGLRSISSFMRRLLAPSEFDILQAKLFGSVNNANTDYFIIAIPLILVAGGLLMMNGRKLNVLAMGKSVSTSLGLSYQKNIIYNLVLISVLMAVSTALIGPMTFFGFLVATLTYQITPTYDHKYIFPMALALGFIILTGAYFFMNHIFNAQGVVSVIIELFGGITFLIVLLRKESL